MNEQIKQYIRSGSKNLIVIYALYLCGIVEPGLPVIGAIFAYLHKEDNNRFLSSHYIFLFRTFCFGALGFVIAKITMIIFIGLILQVALAMWFILRVVIGLRHCIHHQTHPNPMTYYVK